jgi:hypothetical protein
MSQYRLRSKELKISELQKQLQHVNLNAAQVADFNISTTSLYGKCRKHTEALKNTHFSYWS